MAGIVIIDYNLGNLFSVENALKSVTNKVEISSNHEQIREADAIVLPGVGAFGEAIKNLNNSGLSDLIIEQVKQGKPFLGICLGLQLLFTDSEEFGLHKGLGLIKGTVKKLPNAAKEEKSFIPQIGWNKLSFLNDKSKANSPLKHMTADDFMYFVHSYYVVPEDISTVLTTTNYQGIDYCSSVLKNNIFACQFHPEKSGNKGLEIYREWIEMNNLK